MGDRGTRSVPEGRFRRLGPETWSVTRDSELVRSIVCRKRRSQHFFEKEISDVIGEPTEREGRTLLNGTEYRINMCVSMSVCTTIRMYRHVCGTTIRAYRHKYVSTYVHIDICTYRHTCISTVYTNVRTHLIRVCQYTRVLTYVRTNVRTYRRVCTDVRVYRQCVNQHTCVGVCTTIRVY